eukprot:XP_011415912.1 PREDICTED: protein SpAN-like [Crassostrea gigas]
MSNLLVCGILVLFINMTVVSAQGRARGRGVRSVVPVWTWPRGVVPYEIPGDFDEPSKALIKVAMKRWERQTCVRFVPRSEHAKSEAYIKLYKSKNSCFSDIGRNPTQQPQLLGLSDGCMGIPSIVHELGHALGMIHPMSRDDRDQYITLRAENINNGSDRNFLSISDRGYMYFTYGVPYDYKSIMHYNAKIWSKNGNDTMVTVAPEFQTIIGTADDVSFRDNLYINRAYLCSWQCPWMRCENGGVASGTPCRCVCPDGYRGNYCEKRLPGVNRIVDWTCRTGWFYRAGTCYRFLSHATVPWKTAHDLCQQNRGELPVITDTEMMRITGELVLEDRELSTAKTFWLGLQLNTTSGLYMWTDGSELKHPEWIDNPGELSSNRACAVFNGTAITVTSCGLQPDNGVLCVAPFDSSCGGVFYLTHRGVEVTSPNFPDLHPPDITCQYVFKISRNNRIEITFKDFLLEYSNNCQSDSLEVQLETDVSIPGKRYCGSELTNTTLVSKGNFAIVTLRTNARNHGRGFQLTANPVQSRARSISDHFMNIPISFWKKLFEVPGRFGLG